MDSGKKSVKSSNSSKDLPKKFLKPSLKPSKSQRIKIKKKKFKLDKPILSRSRSRTFREEISKSPILNLETKSDGSGSLINQAKSMVTKYFSGKSQTPTKRKSMYQSSVLKIDFKNDGVIVKDISPSSTSTKKPKFSAKL